MSHDCGDDAGDIAVVDMGAELASGLVEAGRRESDRLRSRGRQVLCSHAGGREGQQADDDNATVTHGQIL